MIKKKRLIWKLYPSYLLITLIALVTVGWYASVSFRYFFFEQSAADLKTRALLIAQLIENHLSPLNADQIDIICKEIGKASSTRITIMLPSGRVVGDSLTIPDTMDNHADRPEMIAALKKGLGISTRYSRTLEKNVKILYVAIPLKINTQIMAVARLSVPVTLIEKKLKGIQIRIAFAGVLIALLAAFISWVVSRRISRPVEDIKAGAKRFAQGDLKHRLQIKDSEEIASLSEMLNQMAAKLDDRIQTTTRHRNELETVLLNMLEGIIAVDKNERIISINRAALHMFDIHPSQLQNRLLQEIVRNFELEQLIKKTLSSERPIEGDIILYQKSERILHAHTTMLRDTNDKLIGALVVMNDVTQLRRLENMRRDFAANVSHEIKTPLTAIKGFVETLCHGAVTDPAQYRHFLAIIEKHVNRLAAIIEDLMNLSRIEQSDEKKEIRIKENSIRTVIQNAIQICRPQAMGKDIELVLNCDEEVTAKIDPPLIEQAIVNLIDNAIKYSGVKSEIQVEVSLEETDVTISIKDHGVGIAKKHLPRLFERFYRVDKARSRKLGGTGLGLAIVKHIVQAHGGFVTVDSILEKGSVFKIHLPKIK
ncbi:MAG: PAS domain-containing protein [Desulfobacterales bacterium]|nr:PAS domain-containing protein [Desulfobacterales bacterium]